MKTLRFVYCLLICLLMLLMMSCHLTITVDKDGVIGDDNTSVLPDPSGGDPHSPGNDAEQARQDEVDQFIATVIYHGATIYHTIQLPSGDIIDGLDRNTLPLPYPLPALPFTPDALPPGVELPIPDFDQYPELANLVSAAAPIQRPNFSDYVKGLTDATSIQDYLDRYTVGGQQAGTEQLYAGLISHEWTRGVFGYMNQFRPKVEPGSLSLIEFAVGCDAGGDLQEVVGVVISVDKANGWDSAPRLHVEYARPNPYTGKLEYIWDGWDGQFRANPFRRHRPGQIVDVSTLAGRQVEHLMGVFQMPVTRDWWIWYKDEWLGYYPAGLFTMLNDGACKSVWYGEVGRRKPTSPTNWPETQMGSGQHGSAGPLLAAYVRSPQYLDVNYGFGLVPKDDPVTKANRMQPEVDDCYTRTDLIDGLFHLGGDGGNNPYCLGPP